MEFYHSIFGGELTISTYAESNLGDEEEKDLVMHAQLKTNYFTLMASDGGNHHTGIVGDNVKLSLSGDDEASLTEYFNKLSEGGKIDMPLAKQFWGDMFGMVVDKYGMQWMVNIAPEK